MQNREMVAEAYHSPVLINGPEELIPAALRFNDGLNDKPDLSNPQKAYPGCIPQQ